MAKRYEFMMHKKFIILTKYKLKQKRFYRNWQMCRKKYLIQGNTHNH